jgi:hypothetical protein
MGQTFLNEFRRSPISTVLNVLQIIMIVLGFYFVGEKIGVFKSEFSQMKKEITDIKTTMKEQADLDKKEHVDLGLYIKKCEYAIVDHTGRAVR